MKKFTLLFVVALLVESCYSYKQVNVDPKTMVIGKEYKIERNNKTSKVVYTQNADSVIFVMKNGIQDQILIKEITSVKEKKFSVVKTILFPIATSIVIVGIVGMTYGGSNVTVGNVNW